MKLTRRQLRWPVVGLATAVVLGAGTAYAVTGSDPAARYRTVAARISDVEQTLSTTGLVDAAGRADLGFGTDGTLSALLVKVGDTVAAGQVIGRLDATALDAALTQAEAELARAVAQLASDRASQAAAVAQEPTTPTTPSNPKSPTTPTTPTQPSDDSSSSAATAKLLKALKKAQDAVILAQSHASQALAAAKDALAAQQAACAADAQATPSAEPTADAGEPAGPGCDSALAAVQQAQQVVSDAQDALAEALGSLGQVLTEALGSVQGVSQDSTRPRARASDVSTGNPTDDSEASDGSDASAGGSTVTAARLASDQASIEEADAAVVAARQNRAQATLRSTRAGTVVALDASVGDAVSAGSTVATVVGGTAVTITGTVTESQVDSVEVGQAVRVSVPGVARSTAGRVTAIGLVADSSSGTTSYPVTVTVEDPAIALPAGSRALMTIVLDTAEHVVTVPTSAVSRRGTGATATATVRTWDGSTLSRTTVRLGAVGAREVAVTSGLKAGDRVVLADLDQAITGASTEVDDRGGLPPSFEFKGPAGGGGGPVTFSKGG